MYDLGTALAAGVNAQPLRVWSEHTDLVSCLSAVPGQPNLFVSGGPWGSSHRALLDLNGPFVLWHVGCAPLFPRLLAAGKFRGSAGMSGPHTPGAHSYATHPATTQPGRR